MTAVQLVAPERGHEEQPLVTDIADEECQELTGRVVGPVQVLDDEHDRPVLTEPAQQIQDGLVQPAARPLRARLRGVRRTRQGSVGEPEVGGDRSKGDTGRRRHRAAIVARLPRHRPDQWPDRLDDGGERERSVRHPHATAAQHERARFAGLAARLGDQPRLADPGLAADEDDPGVAGGRVRERAVEDLELRPTSDDLRADDPIRHPLDDTGRGGRVRLDARRRSVAVRGGPPARGPGHGCRRIDPGLALIRRGQAAAAERRIRNIRMTLRCAAGSAASLADRARRRASAAACSSSIRMAVIVFSFTNTALLSFRPLPVDRLDRSPFVGEQRTGRRGWGTSGGLGIVGGRSPSIARRDPLGGSRPEAGSGPRSGPTFTGRSGPRVMLTRRPTERRMARRVRAIRH